MTAYEHALKQVEQYFDYSFFAFVLLIFVESDEFVYQVKVWSRVLVQYPLQETVSNQLNAFVQLASYLNPNGSGPRGI